LRSDIVVGEDAAVCVVTAAPGYPAEPRVGQVIAGLDQTDTVEGVTVFHAGTRLRDDGAIVVAAVASWLPRQSLRRSRSRCERVYDAVNRIAFEGSHFRDDIALAAVSALGSGPA